MPYTKTGQWYSVQYYHIIATSRFSPQAWHIVPDLHIWVAGKGPFTHWLMSVVYQRSSHKQCTIGFLGRGSFSCLWAFSGFYPFHKWLFRTLDLNKNYSQAGSLGELKSCTTQSTNWSQAITFIVCLSHGLFKTKRELVPWALSSSSPLPKLNSPSREGSWSLPGRIHHWPFLFKPAISKMRGHPSCLIVPQPRRLLLGYGSQWYCADSVRPLSVRHAPTVAVRWSTLTASSRKTFIFTYTTFFFFLSVYLIRGFTCKTVLFAAATNYTAGLSIMCLFQPSAAVRSLGLHETEGKKKNGFWERTQSDAAIILLSIVISLLNSLSFFYYYWRGIFPSRSLSYFCQVGWLNVKSQEKTSAGNGPCTSDRSNRAAATCSKYCIFVIRTVKWITVLFCMKRFHTCKELFCTSEALAASSSGPQGFVGVENFAAEIHSSCVSSS